MWFSDENITAGGNGFQFYTINETFHHISTRKLITPQVVTQTTLKN